MTQTGEIRLLNGMAAMFACINDRNTGETAWGVFKKHGEIVIWPVELIAPGWVIPHKGLVLMAKTRIKGGKKLDAFLRKAKGAKGVKEVEVGFYSTAKYPDGTPVTNVAAWNEFGVPSNNTPERPFFRQAIPRMEAPALALLKAEVDPKTMVVDRRTAGRLGDIGRTEIQKSIVNLRTPKNADVTIHGGIIWRRGKPIVIKA